MHTWLLYAACIGAWGLAAFLMKIAGQRLGPYTAAIFALPGYLFIGAFVAHKADYRLTLGHGAAVTIGALYMLGNMAFYKLCETTELTRLAPATALNLAIPVLLGWLLLREEFSPRKVVGVILAGAALYLLTATGKAVKP